MLIRHLWLAKWMDLPVKTVGRYVRCAEQALYTAGISRAAKRYDACVWGYLKVKSQSIVIDLAGA